MNLHIALAGVYRAAASQFVVARGDSAKVLEFVEEALGGAPNLGRRTKGAPRNPKGTSGDGKGPVALRTPPLFEKEHIANLEQIVYSSLSSQGPRRHCRSTESWS
jgi:hypothetical protein